MYANNNADAVNISYGNWTINPFMGKVNVNGGLYKYDPETGFDNISFSLEITLELPPFGPAPTPANPSGECGAQGDNLLWELNTSTGVLTITGSGAMADWHDDTQRPWYAIITQITSVVLPNGITSIGEKAFRGCTNLASINMAENYPASLTTIKQEAFCHTALTSVTIPESVVTIGQDAFYLSQGITDVYCYADPNNLTWNDYYKDDFNKSPAKSTQCHVKNCHLDVFNTNWNTGNSTDVNVTFVGDLPGECGGSTPAVDQAVQNVIDLINAIPNPVAYNDECKNAIDAARAAYDALNADQKDLVNNYSTLTDAEAAYAALIPNPDPTPATMDITPAPDPQNPTYYYRSFFDSQVKYLLPAGVNAYMAKISGDDLTLTKIAGAGQVLPNNVAVIFRSTVEQFTLTVSDAAAVTYNPEDNSLEGTDVDADIPADCYVLSDEDNVIGFYKYTGDKLYAHKAYVIYPGSDSSAPRRMRFIFAEEQTATGAESATTNVESRKAIENGQLIIIRDGVRYNAVGQIMRNEK